MTPEQIELIKSSWSKVLPIADTAADLFYDRLFEIAPQARGLFPEDMAGQKKALLAMLGRVVASLNNLSDIVPQVQDLGVRHIGYGAAPTHYAIVGEALLWTLEKGLGDEWNEDLKNAWATAYGVLSSTMIDAAEAKVAADASGAELLAQESAEPSAKKARKRVKRTEADSKSRMVSDHQSRRQLARPRALTASSLYSTWTQSSLVSTLPLSEKSSGCRRSRLYLVRRSSLKGSSTCVARSSRSYACESGSRWTLSNATRTSASSW